MGRWRDGRVDDRRGCRVVRAERPFRPLAAYGGTYRRRIDLKLGVAAVIAGRKPVLQFARASVVCASEILNTRLLIARTHSTARSSGQVRPHRRTYVRRRNPSSSLLAVQSPSLFHCLACPGGTAAQGRPAGGGPRRSEARRRGCDKNGEEQPHEEKKIPRSVISDTSQPASQLVATTARRYPASESPTK
ncbi:hypothetical protein ALC53_05437 [Atta colombica]|uniref:Uncharacterized protein n=1 Tax=Atta colombica TaxID=520822 RepID=A0A195BJ32_9HYME|nr:hypothetical protein ALC53_05437 [Atta colombica]